MKNIIIALIILSLSVSCGNHNENKKSYDLHDEPQKDTSVIRTSIDDTLIVSKKEQIVQDFADSLSLCAFWDKFCKDLESNKRKSIIRVLQFPIPAEYFVISQYAHDCDTALYIMNGEKYSGLYIDKNNINAYFDFIFISPLKDAIQQISCKDLLIYGEIHEDEKGLTLYFPSQGYKAKVNCVNDHNIKFHIIKMEHEVWSIKIMAL